MYMISGKKREINSSSAHLSTAVFWAVLICPHSEQCICKLSGTLRF